MTGAEAMQLTDRLRDPRIDDWDVLLGRAYFERAWPALGYRDWDMYCRCELHRLRVRLGGQQRQVIVPNLTELGLSTREIASALNIGIRTVISDRRQMNARIAACATESRKQRKTVEATRNALARPAVAAEKSSTVGPVRGPGAGWNRFLGFDQDKG